MKNYNSVHTKLNEFVILILFGQLTLLTSIFLIEPASSSNNDFKSLKFINFTNITSLDEIAREAMKHLHDELDRDDDGNVSLSEGEQFIDRKDFESYSSNLPGFATDKDGRITEDEFWESWLASAVHNWTVSEMVEWLSVEVELPQYSQKFKHYGIPGAAMPIFLDPEFNVLKKLGIPSSAHKRKIELRAMEIVLFGLPKSKSNLVKDILLTVSLALALSGVAYALHVRRSAARAVAAMQDKLNNLQKEMNKLDDDISWAKDHSNEDLVDANLQRREFTASQSSLGSEQQLQSRLNEVMDELSDARLMLEQAEERLNDQRWLPPEKLILCLKATYKVETKLHAAKRQQAQKKVEQAKSQFLKMKKKTSIFNSVQLVHSHQVDNFDLEVQAAKDLLYEVQQENMEHKRRWLELESVCNRRLISSSRSSVNKIYSNPKDDYISIKKKNQSYTTGSSAATSKRNSESENVAGLQMKEIPATGMIGKDLTMSSMHSCPSLNNGPQENESGPIMAEAVLADDHRPRTFSYHKMPSTAMIDRDRFSERFRNMSKKSISPLLNRHKAAPQNHNSISPNIDRKYEGDTIRKKRPSLEESDSSALASQHKSSSSRSLPDLINDKSAAKSCDSNSIPSRSSSIENDGGEKPVKKRSFFGGKLKKMIKS